MPGAKITDDCLRVDCTKTPEEGAKLSFQADVEVNPETATVTSRLSSGACETTEESAATRGDSIE